MFLSADQRADPVAGLVRHMLSRITGRAAASSARSCAHRRVRDAYGAVVARLVRISIIGLVVVAASAVGHYRPGQDDANRLPARGRPGRAVRVVQMPGGASVARTSDVVAQVETMLKAEHAVADYTSS